tara:strand:+ start:121 stop:882 length:762 start_codon:yes stop_codon:yes gene_type:complete
MAKNWKEAQLNEVKFWADIYLKNPGDKIYEKAKDQDLIGFTNEVLDRHKIKINNFAEKVIVDLGCGPFGIIKGLTLIEKEKKIKINKIFGIDPLMNFYKENINMLKEDDHLELINATGEKIPLDDKKVDYIFSTNVLDHCNIPEKVINEVERILKDTGEFHCSVHVVYPILTFVAPYLKYFDKNHPKHFTENFFLELLKSKFKTVDISYRAKIFEDHPKFKFSNILKNKSFFRGLKRFLSNYILYTAYFSCKK